MDSALPAAESEGAVPHNLLRAGLERALSVDGGGPLEIVSLQRRALAYRSSAHIEEVALSLRDGRSVSVIFKDLSPSALLREAREARPDFLYDPRRELDMYRWVLPDLALGTPRCQGTVAYRSSGRYWLFLEPVEGTPLREIGDLGVWEEAAAWLARFHWKGTRLLPRLQRFKTNRLILQGQGYYARWLRRAHEIRALQEASVRRVWDRVLAAYEAALPGLATLPGSLLHGEFYPSNILVRKRQHERICPVDWEVASVGPACMDLAALVSGKWSERERTRLIGAYISAAQELGVDYRGGLEAALGLCRLHVAVQWLAWSAHWKPPAGQATDWLAEAIEAAALV